MIKKDLFWFLELVLTFYTLKKKHKETVFPQKLFTQIHSRRISKAVYS